MTLTAIYPGTFDPITNGHVDVIERAAKLFDRLIVAVAASHRKAPYFSIDDRLMMMQAVLKEYDRVEVAVFSGLLVDCAAEHQARVIVRGLRAVSDFDFEFQMAGMNHQMNPAIETVMLPSTHEYAYISSSMVREIVEFGGDPSPFVAPIVLQYLQNKECGGDVS